MAAKPSPPLSDEATAGQLAVMLGVTERVVAGRKADGRLPVRENGRIDLAAVIRAGVEVLGDRQRGTTRASGLDLDRRQASDALMGCAANTTAHIVYAALMAPQDGEDPGTAAARGLREAKELLDMLPSGGPALDRLLLPGERIEGEEDEA